MNEGRTGDRRCVLLTGVTGLVGGYLLERLQRRPELELHALVRCGAGQDPRGRLRELGRYFGAEEMFEGCRCTPEIFRSRRWG